MAGKGKPIKKSRAKKSGSGKSRKGLRGKSFSTGARKAPLVNRVAIPGAIDTWQLIPPAQGQVGGLSPMITITPTQSWARYFSGFDISQINSLAVRSRNVSMSIAVQFPGAGKSPKPYQLRVIQGWVKQPVVGVNLSPTTGTSGMSDGIALNFDPTVVFKDHVYQTMVDSVGTTVGMIDGRGNVNADNVRVISDTQHMITNTSVTPGGDYVFPTFNRVFNFRTGVKMRLYPFTTQGAIPASGLPDGYTPINNAGLWIPVVALIMLNFNDYTADADRPQVYAQQSHYWTNL